MEEGTLHQQGAGQAAKAKATIAAAVLSTPLTMMHCPSRRQAKPYKCFPKFVNADYAEFVARTDYAANAGDHVWSEPYHSGPQSVDEVKSGTYVIQTDALAVYTGVCFEFSQIAEKDVVDGTSKTYCVGEKYLNPTTTKRARIRRMIGPATAVTRTTITASRVGLQPRPNIGPHAVISAATRGELSSVLRTPVRGRR